MYSIYFANGTIGVYCDKIHIADINGLCVKNGSQREEIIYLKSMKKGDGTYYFEFRGKSVKNGLLSFEEKDGFLNWKIDIRADKLGADSTVKIFYTFTGLKNVMMSRQWGQWWTMPCFSNKEDDWFNKTNLMVFEKRKKQICLLPLIGNDFVTYINKGYFDLSIGCNDMSRMKGTFMITAIDDDPYAVIEKAYRKAKKEKYIDIPFFEERKLPFMVDSLGWCSWNALYKKVNEADLLKKVEEFKKKKIPVRWILIDDGWEELHNGKLVSFKADKEKFPDGLRKTIQRIKKYDKNLKVGIWLTFNAYWGGIDPDGPIAKKYKNELTFIYERKRITSVIPSLDPEKAEIFWDGYFSYLKNCGVDFVKVDNQSSYRGILKGNAPTASQTLKAQTALERSAKKYFNRGDSINIINCMGMMTENVFSRKESSLSRNSDDFFPNKEGDFIKHVVQNGWNSIWHNLFYCADYDMWMTHHSSAKESSVLRAISGGPIYIADEIGSTKDEFIRPLSDVKGNILRFPKASIPTRDLFYADCFETHDPVKLFNRVDDKFALAVFNIDDKSRKISVKIDDIPGMDKECSYMAYEYFKKKWYHFDIDNDISLTLRRNETLALSIYPIMKNKVHYGDLDKFFSVLTKPKNILKIQKDK